MSGEASIRKVPLLDFWANSRFSTSFRNLFYISDAPKLYYQAIVQADECLEETEKLHCQKYFQENSYWAHNEAITLALLSDDNMEMRQWAVDKIIQIRQETTDTDETRVWRKPTLKFEPLPKHYR